KVYGTDHLYSADTFNENKPPSNDSTYLDAISKKVYQSMSSADPKAVWVMQGWLFLYDMTFWKPTQIKALLNAIPDDKMVILDLNSDAIPVWNRTDAYYGKPWIWNLLSNGGGRVSLFGRMHNVAYEPATILNSSNSGKMVGIGLTPEGIDQNPALYQLMLANVWCNEPIPLDNWLQRYALNRYGKANEQVNKAWKILKNTVYHAPQTAGNGPASMITARPTFEQNTLTIKTALGYDPLQLVKAWSLFIKAGDSLKNSDGFQYDLVNIARQVLANYANDIQRKFTEAYKDHNNEMFDKYSGQFIDLINDMNTLLRTRKDFMLGTWLSAARSWGKTNKEKDLYEFNARDLITLWGDKNSPIHEYACRQWSGMMYGFYKPRWEMFFHEVDSCMKNNKPMNMDAFNKRVKDWEWKWVHEHNKYPIKPSGNPVIIAKEMYNKYIDRIKDIYHDNT
ncbi:MAG: alpha-N-acetylglucosaminidase C-terminal domain-containing protein, partial [Chitinophagaceae bacterium]